MHQKVSFSKNMCNVLNLNRRRGPFSWACCDSNFCDLSSFEARGVGLPLMSHRGSLAIDEIESLSRRGQFKGENPHFP